MTSDDALELLMDLGRPVPPALFPLHERFVARWTVGYAAGSAVPWRARSKVDGGIVGASSPSLLYSLLLSAEPAVARPYLDAE